MQSTDLYNFSIGILSMYKYICIYIYIVLYIYILWMYDCAIYVVNGGAISNNECWFVNCYMHNNNNNNK